MAVETVKGIARSDEPDENYHPRFTVNLSSLFICPDHWFTLTAFIASFSATAGSCFQSKSSRKPLCTTCSAANRHSWILAGGRPAVFLACAWDNMIPKEPLFGPWLDHIIPSLPKWMDTPALSEHTPHQIFYLTLAWQTKPFCIMGRESKIVFNHYVKEN